MIICTHNMHIHIQFGSYLFCGFIGFIYISFIIHRSIPMNIEINKNNTIEYHMKGKLLANMVSVVVVAFLLSLLDSMHLMHGFSAVVLNLKKKITTIIETKVYVYVCVSVCLLKSGKRVRAREQCK